MNKLDAFIAWLISWVNRAIYVWGGQGETITSTGQIYRMETSKINALRAIALWIKRGRSAVCFDCSGILVKWLLAAGFIEYDTTANGLLSMCERITKAQLKIGDWVFRIRDGKAYHIGVVVKIINGVVYVVEAMGRDDGVVMRGLDQHSVVGYWNGFGRPRMFKKEIEYVASAPKAIDCPYIEPERDYKSPQEFSGNDAKWFKWHLNRIGYKFDLALQVGPKTWEALNYEIRQAGETSANDEFRNYLKSVPSR